MYAGHYWWCYVSLVLSFAFQSCISSSSVSVLQELKTRRVISAVLPGTVQNMWSYITLYPKTINIYQRRVLSIVIVSEQFSLTVSSTPLTIQHLPIRQALLSNKLTVILVQQSILNCTTICYTTKKCVPIENHSVSERAHDNIIIVFTCSNTHTRDTHTLWSRRNSA